MKKSEIVRSIAQKTGIKSEDIAATIECFMMEVKESLAEGESVFLRGFGTFCVKTRKQKTARNISKDTTIIVPRHNVPVFKPSAEMSKSVKGEE